MSEFKKGQKVYVTKQNAMGNAPRGGGKVYAVTKNHVIIDTGGRQLYKAHKNNVSFTSEAVSANDEREYGYEGEMAMSQLKGILRHAQDLHDMLEPDTDLPEWVQSKITLAYDYIQTAADYMSTEMNEETIKWVKNKYGSGYTSHDGKRVIIKHPKGWINKSTTDRYDYSDVFPTQREAKANKYAWAMKNEEAPANNAGGGNVAGLGVGSQGEPPVKKKKVLKRFKDM